MKPDTPIATRVRSDRLTLQIESLQDAFRSLASATSMKDLAGRFHGVVRQSFPDGEIGLFYRPGGTEIWQDLLGNGAKMSAGLPTVAELNSMDDRGRDAARIQVVQKLVDSSSIAVVVCVGSAGGVLGDADMVSLRLLAHLFDNAYQALVARRHEKDLIFSLNHRVLQLNSLIDTGIEVAKLDQGTSPLQIALERATSLTNASKGIVTVSDTKGVNEQYVFPAGAPGRADSDVSHQIESSFTFGTKTYRFQLFDKESRNGILPFETTDRLLLDALARQVHASLENHYLHAQALEKQKIEQDMAVAASIQQRIIPTTLPTIKGYDVAGINIPSTSVGGDYYDCIALPDGKYALVIADVAGKGVPAALLVSSLHAYMAAYLESSTPLLDLAGRLNAVINRASTDDKFITAFLAILNPATGELETLNAGHTSTLVLRADGTLQELSIGGIPFGMLDMDFPYQSERIVIAPGERLLLYTDGVTEAANSEHAMYDSHSPLKEYFRTHTPSQASSFIKGLIDDIKRFTGDAPQNDDITALCLLRR